jgi:putative ABC transport system ATP-binding protein
MNPENFAVQMRDASLDYLTAGGEVVRGVGPISWALPRGMSASIVGRSGSGKSSLLALLSTMRQPTSGSVELLGHDVSTLTPTAAARLRSSSIGVVFQSYHLELREPVWWNIALPWVFAGQCSRKAAEARARQLIEQVGLPAATAGRRASELSGGQRQRVAIARALMSEPQLFIADEPTGNLDESTANHIAELIFGLTSTGISVLVVTHDAEVAQRADRSVTLAAGRIRASTA